MKIKIYQVNLDRDEHTAAFRGLYDKPMTCLLYTSPSPRDTR